MFDNLVNNIKGFAPYIFAGAIGAVIHRLRKKMSIVKFMKVFVLSIFVGIVSGIVARDYFGMTENMTFVVCSICGTFSEIILDEFEEGLKRLSDLIAIKMGIDKKREEEEEEEELKEE